MNSCINRETKRQMFLFHLCPSKAEQHGVSIQSLINLGKTFFGISHIWIIAQTWYLARLLQVYLSWISLISQILDFLYWLDCIYIFDGMTVKTQNRWHSASDNCHWLASHPGRSSKLHLQLPHANDTRISTVHVRALMACVEPCPWRLLLGNLC